LITAVVLSTISPAFSQQAEPNSEPGNAVPREVLNGVLQRVLTPRSGDLPVGTLTPRLIAAVPQVLKTNRCAVPLMETRGTETNDRIAQAPRLPDIDPNMAHPPPIPACSKP
jgi:hypothetical protein